jgi:hypothetical protein
VFEVLRVVAHSGVNAYQLTELPLLGLARLPPFHHWGTVPASEIASTSGGMNYTSVINRGLLHLVLCFGSVFENEFNGSTMIVISRIPSTAEGQFMMELWKISLC